MTRRLCPSVCLALLFVSACKGNDNKAPPVDKPNPKAPSAATSTATSSVPKQPQPPPAPRAPLPPDEGEHVGNLTFAVSHGATGADGVRGMAVDQKGDLLISGHSTGAKLFGTQYNAEDADAYVAKLSGSDGSEVWSVRLGGKGVDTADALTLDPSNNVIIAGSFADELTVGTGTLKSLGADDIFIGKFAPDGRRLWVKRIGAIDVDAAHSVVTDKEGNVYATGVFRRSVSFGTDTLVSNGDADIFLTKLSPDGTFLWAKHFGASGPDYGRDIAVDSAGNLILVGEISVGVSFGGPTLTTNGNRDIALVKLSRDGEHIWSRSMGNNDDDIAISISVDPSDDLVLTGSFQGNADYGSGEMVPKGLADAFVAKFSAMGEPVWSFSFGGTDKDWGNGIATDSFGNSYVTGWFWNEVTVGGTTLVSNGKRDAFLLKVSPTGSVLWAKSFGHKGRDMGVVVAAAKDGGVFVGGAFQTELTLGDRTFKPLVGDDPQMVKGDMYISRWGR